MLTGPIALVHANADLFVGILIGIAVGLLIGPLLRAWLTFVEWKEASREAQLTDELIDRLHRDLDELPDPDGTSPDDERTWRTSP